MRRRSRLRRRGEVGVEEMEMEEEIGAGRGEEAL